MQITVGNTITIQNPNEAIKRWCKENLILANPEYAKKLRMHFWLGNTPQTLSLFEVHGTNYVLPFGCLRSILPLSENCPVETLFKEPTRVNYNASVPLYNYQQKAVNAVLDKFYGILQSPAGSGKTQMGIGIITALKLNTEIELGEVSKIPAEWLDNISLSPTQVDMLMPFIEG